MSFEPSAPDSPILIVSTDSEIIRRSIEQPAAFAELYDRHARVVGAFAARRVGSDAGQDVLSETFLVAFRRRRDFDHAHESARPWLLGIAARASHAHRRQEAVQWRSFAEAAARAEVATDAGVDTVGDRTDAEASVRRLAPAIAALSMRDRDTLLLYAWGDLTYDEIGRALGVPTGTVRSRLNRVRRRLAVASGTDTGNDKKGAFDGPVGSRA